MYKKLAQKTAIIGGAIAIILCVPPIIYLLQGAVDLSDNATKQSIAHLLTKTALDVLKFTAGFYLGTLLVEVYKEEKIEKNLRKAQAIIHNEARQLLTCLAYFISSLQTMEWDDYERYKKQIIRSINKIRTNIHIIRREKERNDITTEPEVETEEKFEENLSIIHRALLREDGLIPKSHVSKDIQKTLEELMAHLQNIVDT